MGKRQTEPGGRSRIAAAAPRGKDGQVHPETRYARNGDVSLAYQVVGDGPRDLLLVFGFLSNIEFAWMYPSLASFLTRLASFSRLILMDRRGSGLSDRFEDAPPAETMLRDIEVVLDEVGSPKTTLFGLWDGAVTCVLFAATHPERVSSLVLFTVSAAQKPADDYPWAWDDAYWEEWLASIRHGWGTRAWVVKNARWMGPSMLDDQNELDRWISYTRLAASPASAEAVMRVSSESDIREILPIIRTPALILHRIGDLIEPIDAARYVSRRMPNARLVELSGDDGIPLARRCRVRHLRDPSVPGRGPGKRGRWTPPRDGVVHRHRRVNRAPSLTGRRRVDQEDGRTRRHLEARGSGARRSVRGINWRRTARGLRRSRNCGPVCPGD